MNNGTLGILNVGEGDVKLSFDPGDALECARAARIVGDMLKRGFAILIHAGKIDGEDVYKRAVAFDPKTHEYIIAADTQGDVTLAKATPAEPSASPVAGKRGRPRKTEQRISAATTRAVSVGRTAGGYDPVLPDRIVRGFRDVHSVIM